MIRAHHSSSAKVPASNPRASDLTAASRHLCCPPRYASIRGLVRRVKRVCSFAIRCGVCILLCTCMPSTSLCCIHAIPSAIDRRYDDSEKGHLLLRRSRLLEEAAWPTTFVLPNGPRCISTASEASVQCAISDSSADLCQLHLRY